jgi:hypothetical protein
MNPAFLAYTHTHTQIQIREKWFVGVFFADNNGDVAITAMASSTSKNSIVLIVRIKLAAQVRDTRRSNRVSKQTPSFFQQEGINLVLT